MARTVRRKATGAVPVYGDDSELVEARSFLERDGTAFASNFFEKNKSALRLLDHLFEAGAAQAWIEVDRHQPNYSDTLVVMPKVGRQVNVLLVLANCGADEVAQRGSLSFSAWWD